MKRIKNRLTKELARVGRDIVTGSIGGGIGAYYATKKISQNKNQKCIKKNPVKLTDSHNVKMKKLRSYNRCMKK